MTMCLLTTPSWCCLELNVDTANIANNNSRTLISEPTHCKLNDIPRFSFSTDFCYFFNQTGKGAGADHKQKSAGPVSYDSSSKKKKNQAVAKVQFVKKMSDGSITIGYRFDGATSTGDVKDIEMAELIAIYPHYKEVIQRKIPFLLR